MGWVGSDFVEQGKRAADAMITATGGNGNLAILLGAAGINVTTDRTQGFEDELAAQGLQDQGRRPADGRLRAGEGPEGHRAAHPGQPRHQLHLRRERRDGARRGRRAQGRRQEAGRRQDRHHRRHQGAVQGIVDGWINGVIESNPRFGPLAFKALADFYGGDGVPEKTIISDKEYTKDNAEQPSCRTPTDPSTERYRPA